MKTRILDESGARVSEIGLGTWQIGGSWGEVAESDALEILRAAGDNGVTFFDTADVYGDGRSERLIGQFLREKPSEIFVATKLGRNSQPGGNENYTPAAMRLHTENSLRNLGVEALDLTQLHCIPTEELRRGEVFEILRELKKEGKIRRFGASVESMEEAHLCLKQDGLSSLQIIFNIFRQKPIEDLFAAAQAKNVGIIVRLPLASGLLSGKISQTTQFSPDDHRNFNQNGEAFNVGETFAGLGQEKGAELSEKLKSLLPNDVSMAKIALRWILDFDAVTTVIPGASRVSQVESNVAASDLAPLSPDLHAQLKDFYEREVREFVRGPY